MAFEDAPRDPDTPDEPIAVLVNLEHEPVSDFAGRVRRGIERRFLSRDLIGFYVAGITCVVMEWLALGFERFAERFGETGKGAR